MSRHLVDEASLEAAIARGEQLARELICAPGLQSVAARFGLACYRPLLTAVMRESERGETPLTIIHGLEPLVANAVSTVLLNTTLDEEEAVEVLRAFAEDMINEAYGRFRTALASGPGPEVAAVKTLEGGVA